jgi:hypothetical protein
MKYDIFAAMEKEIVKNAKVPNLVEAAEYLHSALEIFEDLGLQKNADQVLEILYKIAKNNKFAQTKAKPLQELLPIKKLMEAGLTQKDMNEFAKGNPVAKAKINLVMKGLGISDHEIAKFIGFNNVMSEEDAHKLLDPNRALGKINHWIEEAKQEIKPGNVVEFKSVSKKPLQYDIDNADDLDVEFNDSLEVFDKEIPLEDFEDEKF